MAVSDLSSAADFYTRLLGRPADASPMPSLTQWELASGGVQVVEAPEHAGHSMATLLVPDLDATLADLGAAGMASSEPVSGVVSRLVQVRDPDGNVVTIAEQPTPDEPRPVVGMYSFVTPDPRRLGDFYARLMDLPVADESSDDVVFLDLHHVVTEKTWIIERGVRPDGPSAVGLDIGHPTDATGWASVAARAESLGADRIAEHEQDGVRWIELNDPDGNRLRMFAPRPS